MNNKKTLIVFPLVILLALVLSGCFALAEPEASSGAVDAPTMAAPAAALESAVEPTAAAAEVEPTPLPATAVPAEAEEAYPAGEAPAEPQGAAPAEAYPAEESAETAQSGGAVVFEIDPARSEARFTINEVLRGAPTTVVGVSRNLGGQVAVDFANPASTQVGTILINARDFATDNEFRNRALSNEILLTNEHEFVTFEPTAVSGLPAAITIGETYDLQITGDLTIIGTTQEVTFDAQVTPLSATELQGSAAVDLLYADFGVTVPFARAVESVEDSVNLALDFVAVAQ